MKQFSLEEYLKNPVKKVVTRNGNSVRIICTDRNADYPIVGLVKGCSGLEKIESFDIDGKYPKDSSQEEKDLFFASEKHEGWMNIYKTEKGPIGSWIYDSKEEAEEKVNGVDYITTCKVEWEE